MPRDVVLIWERSLGIPSPWRIAVLLVLAVLVIRKLLPWAVRTIGGLVRLGVGPLVAALLFPEYLLTTWRRGRGHPPLRGTHAYDNGVERTADLLHRTSKLAMRTLGRPRKISWGLIAIIALVPAVLWYTERALPDNRVTHPVVELVGSAQRPLLVADAWVLAVSGVDGSWNPEGCPEPPPKKPPKKKRK